MTDGQSLFVVFAGLYMLECARLVPAYAWICRGRAKGRWRASRPPEQLTARGVSLALLRPLPPFDAHFIAMPWLFLPRTDHLRINDGSTVETIPWSGLNPRVEGSSVRLVDGKIVRLPSEALAVEWRDRLRSWSELPPERRDEAFLEFAAQSLDTQAVDEVATSLMERTRDLRANAAWIMLWCFGVVAGIHAWYGETPRLWLALCGLFLLQFVQAATFWRAAGREPAIRHRFWKAVVIALLPQHGIRAPDHFCRVVSITPHPLAARGILLDAQFVDLAKRFWREARFQPGWRTAEALPVEAEALRRYFKSADIALETLEEAPAHDGASVSFCPKCLAQFLATTTECRGCGGVELRPFEVSKASHSQPSD